MAQTHVRAALTRVVTERAQGLCEYCHCLSGFHSDPFAVEHIAPEARGGATEAANLALSCLGCNSFKAAFVTGRDPATERDAPLFHLNRPGLVNLRAALRHFGVHPPDEADNNNCAPSDP